MVEGQIFRRVPPHVAMDNFSRTIILLLYFLTCLDYRFSENFERLFQKRHGVVFIFSERAPTELVGDGLEF